MRNLSLLALFALASCSTSVKIPSEHDMAAVPTDMSAVCGGGPVTGAADAHCLGDAGPQALAVDAAACMAPGGATTPTFGATMFGTSGYDDGCKYLVSYKVSPICEGRPTAFTVILKNALDGTLVTGANPTVDVTLDETHKAPESGTVSSEISPGVYNIGPVDFDGTGTWVVRFHFFDDCVELPTSPRGQAAFFISVR